MTIRRTRQMISKNLEKLIFDISKNIDEGEYDGCNGSPDREILYDIERHECFKAVSLDPLCSNDILELVKFYKEASNW
jgi:hypothetical protein